MARTVFVALAAWVAAWGVQLPRNIPQLSGSAFLQIALIAGLLGAAFGCLVEGSGQGAYDWGLRGCGCWWMIGILAIAAYGIIDIFFLP